MELLLYWYWNWITQVNGAGSVVLYWFIVPKKGHTCVKLFTTIHWWSWSHVVGMEMDSRPFPPRPFTAVFRWFKTPYKENYKFQYQVSALVLLQLNFFSFKFSLLHSRNWNKYYHRFRSSLFIEFLYLTAQWNVHVLSVRIIALRYF